jgi:hypothetical protein
VIGSGASQVTSGVPTSALVTVSVRPEAVAANMAFAAPFCGSGSLNLSFAITSAAALSQLGDPLALPAATISGVHTRSEFT